MLKFLFNSPLFEEAGDGAGGAGGGGGAGAGGNSGAFDPVAFETKILGEIDSRLNKTINGFGKTFKNDIQKMFEGLKPAAAAGSGAGSGAGDGAGGGSGAGDGAGAGKGAANPEVNALQLEIRKLRETYDGRVKTLEDAKAETEKRASEMERDGALRDALGKFEFMTPEAKTTAFQIFRPLMQHTDDGYVAGELPLDKFLENELPTKHAYLIKGKEVGGAGARPGKTGAGSKKWDIARDTRPENFSKLSPQDQAELRAYIAQS